MKKSYFAFAASIAMMLVSCSGEIKEDQPEGGLKDGVKMTFTAVTETPASKTSIDMSNGTVAWSEGDKAKFAWGYPCSEGATSGVIESEEIDLEGSTFSVELPAEFQEGDQTHLYAVYPSTTDVTYASNGGEFLVTVPDVQNGDFASASIAIAKADKTDLSKDLQFNNLCGLLQVVIEDANARKMVVKGNETIAGQVSIGFGTGVPAVSKVKSAKTEITVSVDGAGTYYVAVLPAAISGLCIDIYDSADMLIGNKAAEKELIVERRQIKKLGTIKTGFSDRYYVKAYGTGDGSSWDNAADYAGLSAKLSANNSTLNVFIAAGTYNVTAQAAMGTANTAAKNVIKGGYPADAAGHDLSGRDAAANETAFDANDACRIWILQRGSWTIDGITFKRAKRTGSASDSGSALVIESNAGSSFNISNCRFTANSNEKLGGGAVRVSNATVNMKNCTFSKNSATKDGGAVYVSGTGVLNADHCVFSQNTVGANGGAVAVAGSSHLNATDCDFDSNSAAVSAGAIYSLDNSVAGFNLCTFRSNTAKGTDSSNGGGAAFATANSKAYFNRCFFANNTDEYNAHHIYSGATTYVGLNNCVVRGPWGVTKTHGSLLQIKGFNVIVNSTIYCQTGDWGAISLGSKDANGSRIINDIVINKSSAQLSFYTTSYYQQVYNTIYSKEKDGNTDAITFSFTDCLADASCRTDGNFPTAGSIWGADGERFDLDGNRYIYVYPWNGTTDAGTVTKTSLENIKTLIGGTTNIGTEFLAWLESDELKVNGYKALEVDIRGVARNTAAIWPGSYESNSSASASASIENLNLR